MNFWHSLLKILDTEMTTPVAFGWFHILFIILSLAAAFVLCLCYKKGYIKNVDRVILAVSIIVMAFEIYKQINFSFDTNDNFKFEYQWYAFTFQFCSTPMYIGLLAGIFKKGKLHDCLCAYLSTYAVFAGICVMLMPGDVFIGTVGINIQTMVCHGSMITLGIFLYYTKHVKAELRTVLKAAPVFASCVGVAVILNEIAYYSGLLTEHNFNMFYVSRHCEPHLFVYSSVQEVVPYPWCLIIYILGFTLAATLVLLAGIGICALANLIKNKARAGKKAVA